MKVSITSDGTPQGTRVNGPDGVAISGIVGISWRIGVGGRSEVDLEMLFVPLERIDGVARMIGPQGKEVRRVEYADGSVDEFPEE